MAKIIVEWLIHMSKVKLAGATAFVMDQSYSLFAFKWMAHYDSLAEVSSFVCNLIG